MPEPKKKLDPMKLAVLRNLRREKKLSQEEVAAYFGLEPSARNEISKWENGEYEPPAHHRPTFIRYLTHKLGLCDWKQFSDIWNVLEDQWGWPITYHEWQIECGGGPPPPRINTAPPHPGLIVGREADLAHLKARLHISTVRKPTGPVRVLTAVRGLPGVGKTTTALALAHDPDVARAFPDGVLWAALGENPSLFSELAEWAHI